MPSISSYSRGIENILRRLELDKSLTQWSSCRIHWQREEGLLWSTTAKRVLISPMPEGSSTGLLDKALRDSTRPPFMTRGRLGGYHACA